MCALCTCTCLQREKESEDGGIHAQFEFHRPREQGVHRWLETQAAELVGALHPGKPSTKKTRRTIEDLLLEINFPMEQKECQGSVTKAMHLNHECHSSLKYPLSTQGEVSPWLRGPSTGRNFYQVTFLVSWMLYEIIQTSFTQHLIFFFFLSKGVLFRFVKLEKAMSYMVLLSSLQKTLLKLMIC